MLSKKSIKVISIIMMVVMLLVAMGNVAFAYTVPSPNKEVSINSEVTGGLSTILGIMQWVGYAAAVVVAMYLGITYITKSPEGKAEIKKQLPLFIGGIAILVFASAIVTAIKTNLGG